MRRLAVEISATEVTRITLIGDRIARVIRSPGGFAAEHDPASGDLYLRPLDRAFGAGPAKPAALFVGTEKGFTYRLDADARRGRPGAGADPQSGRVRGPWRIGGKRSARRRSGGADPGGGAARAARRLRDRGGSAPRPGRVRHSGGLARSGLHGAGARPWPGGAADAAALAELLGPGIAAAWMSGPGPDGDRHAVAVHENAGSAR